MHRRTRLNPILVSTLALLLTGSSRAWAQASSGAPPPKAALVVSVRARDGGVLPEAIRERLRTVPNVGQVERFLEGKASDGVRVIGVEPSPTRHLRSGNGVVPVAIVQGRGFEAGDAPEAMVVGKTFAQKNKTALGLSIPAMLTKDHFPPIVVGGQGFAILGIYATGDPSTDDQVLVLLPTAQKLLNHPGRVSGLYVRPAASAEQVASDLRRALGTGAEVTVLPRRGP